jgi:hypothetical protein
MCFCPSYTEPRPGTRGFLQISPHCGKTLASHWFFGSRPFPGDKIKKKFSMTSIFRLWESQENKF